MEHTAARRRSVVKRMMWFVSAFSVSLLLQISIGIYQSQNVLAPLEARIDSIQDISQFLNTTTRFADELAQYRWGYGDVVALTQTIREHRMESTADLEALSTDLNRISEEQYLLTCAVKTTCSTYDRFLDETLALLEAGKSTEASALYFGKAQPCGSYLVQYTKELLEQAILDNQSSYRSLVQLSNTLNTLEGIALLMCLLTSIPLSFSTRAMFRFIRSLSVASRDISNGNLDTPDLNEHRSDEIGEMARAFNEMKHSMKRQVALLEENNAMEQEMLRRENDALEMQNLLERSQMQLLRSQIDPHFLFNTLNVIMYTARQENAAKTNAMLESLSHLFRYSLESNEAQVSLAREIHIVNSFFSLYHARFGDRVTLRWQISPEVDISETMVPPFILQPLAENAFKHGLAPKEENGTVTIRIHRDAAILRVDITDDGVGISPEVLDALRQGIKTTTIPTKHIGVFNVAARLRLLGPEYGLDISSENGNGTTVSLRLPLVTTMEDDDYDQDDDC